ncbi:dihydrodipicolinate synthase family protein [Pelagibius sp.]|uniref:dihydrodipicolinate synthase family protein n=1 Tax=Pelagibius sp. TaxID=1931238 RepID=UPI003BAF9D58
MSDLAVRGIFAAPVLPMKPDFEIDWEILRSYIDWVASQDPAGIAMNMDASEAPSLSRDEQREVIEICRNVIADRCPLVSGLIATSTADAVAWGNELKAAGAQGLAIFPPMPTFLGKPVPGDMIYRYHASIAEDVNLPMIVFQFPVAWGPDFPPDVLERLAGLPQVVGMKEASFDAARTTETVETAKRLPRKIGIMTGSDTFIFEAFVMGCDGALIGFAATGTAEMVAMHRAVEQGRYPEAKAIWERFGPLARYAWRAPLRDYRPRMKEVLAAQGIIPHATARPPQLGVSNGERAELCRLAVAAGLLNAEPVGV